MADARTITVTLKADTAEFDAAMDRAKARLIELGNLSRETADQIAKAATESFGLKAPEAMDMLHS